MGVIVIEVARPDFPVSDRSSFADTDLKAAAKGFYLIRDFDPDKPKDGYVLVQGFVFHGQSCVSAVTPRRRGRERPRDSGNQRGTLQASVRRSTRIRSFPAAAKYDLMVVTTGTRRMWPVQNVGPLTDEYSLTSDWDNQWLTGGSEADVIAEAHLDAESIYKGIKRFAADRDSRLSRQREALCGTRISQVLNYAVCVSLRENSNKGFSLNNFSRRLKLGFGFVLNSEYRSIPD